MLRVHDLAREVVAARELGRVAARRSRSSRVQPEQEAAVSVIGCAVAVSTSTVQRAVVGVPARRAIDLVAGSGSARSTPYSCGDVAQVVEDRRAVGERLVAAPRPPAVAEGEHVGVGADAGVAEQVPGAAARRRAPRAPRRCGAGAARAAGRPRRCRTGRLRRSGRRRARCSCPPTLLNICQRA